jgi:DNA-directed RNA polymerase omega subunit
LQEIVHECRKRIQSPYKLSILASKRAKQLQMGAPQLVENKLKNYTNIALLEIAKGKVTFDNVAELEKTVDLRKLDTKLITFGSSMETIGKTDEINKFYEEEIAPVVAFEPDSEPEAEEEFDVTPEEE